MYVDRDIWEKVVFNLLSNALKFTFQGKISVHVTYDTQGMVLEVRDTGTGIPESEIPHLFERFHRIQGARSRTHEGSGIGLSLVQNLVRLHGGDVRVESTEGKGTAFWIHIPFGCSHLPKDQVSADAQSPTVRFADAYIQEASVWLPEMDAIDVSSPSAPCSSPKEKPKILVIDDNADMRAYLARILSPQWNVEHAADGSEALQSIARNPPDLVLSDIMMPRLNGFELLDRLRQDPATRHLPIILLSARAGGIRAEGISAGADDYLLLSFIFGEKSSPVSIPT